MGTINELLKESVKDKAEKIKGQKEIITDIENFMDNVYDTICNIILNKFDDATIDIDTSDFENGKDGKFVGSISIESDKLFDQLILAKYYINKDKDFDKIQKFQKLLAYIAIFKVVNKAYGTKNYTKMKKIISRFVYNGKEYFGEKADEKIDNEILTIVEDIIAFNDKNKLITNFSELDTDTPYITNIEVTQHDLKCWVEFKGVVPEEYAGKEEFSENPFNKIKHTINSHKSKPLSEKDKPDIIEQAAKSFGKGIKDFKSKVKVIDLSTEDGVDTIYDFMSKIFGNSQKSDSDK